jgi:hypothetical protein
LQVVRESLPLSEQLLEVAEAADHGLPAHVDDFGIRQHQMDQANVPEVVRHFVDEARPIAAPVASESDRRELGANDPRE